MDDQEQLRFDSNGVRLHAIAAGAGRPVLLLHGFPEAARAWDRQLVALAPHARPVALDMRGYGRSDKPTETAAYALDLLVSDVLAVMDAMASEPVVLVGHDWGGVVAWAVAAARPERLAHLLIVNAPHPALLARRVADDPAQAAASSYIAALSDPGAERQLIESGLGGFWDRVFGDAAARGALGPTDRAQAISAWSAPGALSAMLAYYRANPITAMAGVGRIRVPTSVLWGLRDGALLPCLLAELPALVDELSVTTVPDAGHWLPHERPALVTEAILAALRPAAGRS